MLAVLLCFIYSTLLQINMDPEKFNVVLYSSLQINLAVWAPGVGLQPFSGSLGANGVNPRLCRLRCGGWQLRSGHLSAIPTSTGTDRRDHRGWM